MASNEDYLKKRGFEILWNDDGAIDLDKEIKQPWFKKVFPKKERSTIENRFRNILGKQRTIADVYQRDEMKKFVDQVINNPDVPNHIRESLKKTKENLIKIDNAPTKESLAESLRNAKNKTEKDKLMQDWQKNQYFKYPENKPVKFADTIDDWTGILGEHTDKPTIIKSTSPDHPSKRNYANMGLNVFNKTGRAIGAPTIGALTDAARWVGGAPLQHGKALVRGTGPMAMGAVASMFWPNAYFKKLAEAEQGVLNQKNPLTYSNSYVNSKENALLSRYKKAVDPILDYTIPDIRKNGYYGKDPVKIRNLMNSKNETPLLEKFKENIIPFLEEADARLEAAGIPVEERYKYLTRQMESGEIQNFILRDLLGFRSKEENDEILEKYIKSKGLDDETAGALRDLYAKYAEKFNPNINLMPSLIRETADGKFDVSPFVNNYNEYVQTSKDKGLAFSEGLQEGGALGAGLGAITGLLTGKGIGGKLKAMLGQGLSGGAVGGLTSGIIDGTRAAFFTDEILPKIYPDDEFQSTPFRGYLANTGNTKALPQDEDNNTLIWDLMPWKERLGWKEPPKPEVSNKVSNKKESGNTKEDVEFQYLTDW